MNGFEDAAYNMAAVSATVALYRALTLLSSSASQEPGVMRPASPTFQSRISTLLLVSRKTPQQISGGYFWRAKSEARRDRRPEVS
jgi:hypothetical protein